MDSDACDAVEGLTLAKRKLLERRLGVGGLSDRERRFVELYAVHLDGRVAAQAAGYAKPGIICWRLLNTEQYACVRAAVDQKLAECEAESDLRGEYVRAYIKSVLDFCPTDYFKLGPDGAWTVSESEWDKLPVHVKRLVEGVELRFVAKRPVLCVKFVSKTAALAMAAKYTLTQKFQAAVSGIPWESIAKGLEEQASDTVAARLLEYEGGPDASQEQRQGA